ncbi:MAG: glucokinase [Nitrospirota bacterium]|nr:glucokinase [Nitrospirota bacterium]MDH4359661.1 glucokinase [Nitrospirota bacterium]
MRLSGFRLPSGIYLGYGATRLTVEFFTIFHWKRVMILAGDIGGTKINLALYDWNKERVDPIREDTVWTADYESLEEVLTEFLEEPPPADSESDEAVDDTDEPSSGSIRPAPLGPLTAACFGVPGPVLNNICHATNIPWTIDGGKLAEFLNIPRVHLLNDLEATAYGLQLLRQDEIENLNPNAPSPPPDGTRVLLAAGTGLGESLLLWTGSEYRICPSEGGHADFAPTNDLEIDLLRYLRTSHLHVSYERVLSGPGLHSIYQFLRDTKKNEPTWFAEKLPTGDPAALIAEAGLTGKPDICRDALQIFISIYGAEAGNMALKALALGGVYLGGGIAPKILPALQQETFMKAFLAKGRYKRLLGKIPVRVILNPHTALLGAASVAAGMTT